MRLLYHLPMSPYSRKVRLVLAEKKLPFELQIEKTWDRRPEYLALNPAGTVPTLVEEDGLVVADSGNICEYLDEAYPEMALIGRSVRDRVEVRRLVAFCENVFAAEVTRRILDEKYMKRLAGRGNPDVTVLRNGYAALKLHMEHIGQLSEHRQWLAGAQLSLADFAFAAHLSALDFAGELDWTLSPSAREWYARMKSRPSFRPLLADRVPGVNPPAHYANLDF